MTMCKELGPEMLDCHVNGLCVQGAKLAQKSGMSELEAKVACTEGKVFQALNAGSDADMPPDELAAYDCGVAVTIRVDQAISGLEEAFGA